MSRTLPHLYITAISLLCLIPNPALSMAKGPVWLILLALFISGIIWVLKQSVTLSQLLGIGLLTAICLRPDELAYSGGLLLGGVLLILIIQGKIPFSERILTILFAIFTLWTSLCLGILLNNEILPFKTIEGWPAIPRMTSFLGHANYTSGLGILLAPFCLSIAWEYRKKTLGRWANAATIAALFCLLAGGSRAGIIALGIISMTFGTILYFKIESIRKWILAIFTVTLLSILTHPVMRDWMEKPSIKLESDLVRRDYAQSALSLFSEHPIFGSPQIPLKLLAHQPVNAEQYSCYQVHSTPLQLLCQFGATGFIIYLGIALFLLLEIFKTLKEESPPWIRLGILASTGGYLLFSIFDYQLNIPAIALPFFAMLGLLLKSEKEGTSYLIKPRWKSITIPLACLSLFFGLFPEGLQRYHLFQAAHLKKEGTGPLLMEIAKAPASSENPVIDALIASYAMNAIPLDSVEKKTLNSIADSAWERACNSPLAMPQFFLYRAKLHESENPKISITYAAEAIKRFPKQPSAWILLSKIYTSEGLEENALHCQAVAALISPETFYVECLKEVEKEPKKASRLLQRIEKIEGIYKEKFPHDKYAINQIQKTQLKMKSWLSASLCSRTYLAQNDSSETSALSHKLSPMILKIRLSKEYRRVFGREPANDELENLYKAWQSWNPPTKSEIAIRYAHGKAELGTFGLFSSQGDHPVLPGFFEQEEDLFASWAVYGSEQNSLRLNREFLKSLLPQ